MEITRKLDRLEKIEQIEPVIEQILDPKQQDPTYLYNNNHKNYYTLNFIDFLSNLNVRW